MVAIDRNVTNLMFALLRKIDQYGPKFRICF